MSRQAEGAHTQWEALPPPAPNGRQGRLRGLIGVVVSVVSLAAVLWWASRQPTPSFPDTPGRLALIGLAVGVYTLATLVRGWRWHLILRHAGIQHAKADAYGLVPVGYMGNTVLPARGGEALRIVFLGRRSTAKRREILGSIISERLLDACSLVVLFVVLTWLGVAGTPVGQRPAILALAALGLGAAAVQVYFMVRRRGHLERFAAVVRPVVGGAKPLLGRWGAAVLGVTFAIWMCEGVIFWLVAQALDLDVGLLDAAFLLVLTAFFSLIPAAPGYVGTFDAAVVFGLDALSVVGGQAVAFALLVRFVLFAPITLVGLGLLLFRYGGLAELARTRRAREDGGAGPAAAG